MAMSTSSQVLDYMRDLSKHFFSFWKENAEKVCDDEEDIRGKIVIVTGCNTGIGKQAALQLAKRGAVLIMGVRNLEKGEVALNEIKKKLEGQEIHIELMPLDLGDMQSIKDFVNSVQAKYDHVDILVNNAGLMDTNPVVQKTKDGFEQHIGVNHLGPFLLTRLLLPLLQKAPSPSRIVCVASSNLAIAPTNFLEDLMMEKGPKTGDYGKEQYGISKLCNAICMKKLANNNSSSDGGFLGDNVKLVQLCPGLVKTEVFRNESGFLRKIRNSLSLAAVGLTTHQGCETVVYCAVSKSVWADTATAGRGEIYRFKRIWEAGNKILSDYLIAPGVETTDKLYNLSEQLVGLTSSK